MVVWLLTEGLSVALQRVSNMRQRYKRLLAQCITANGEQQQRAILQHT